MTLSPHWRPQRSWLGTPGTFKARSQRCDVFWRARRAKDLYTSRPQDSPYITMRCPLRARSLSTLCCQCVSPLSRVLFALLFSSNSHLPLPDFTHGSLADTPRQTAPPPPLVENPTNQVIQIEIQCTVHLWYPKKLSPPKAS